ncbi:MAG: DNA polymerase III subunit gamma/tau [Candidatus Poribacteria bacterium]
MPYVVLARRGRPQLFSSVVGQEHVTRTLQNAISSNRIAHAYLLTGPRGVGKTTIARLFAKAINCKNRDQSEPCNVCNSCVEISSGRSIDIIEIDAASNRGIDEIRELRENVKFAPVSVEYKVYIIDEVHMLTTEAFNALLKTLEEPPHHVVFILATTEAHKIPMTILSRCQRFDLRMLTRSQIVGRLKELLKSEVDSDNVISVGSMQMIDDDSLSLIAENADGALRDAESMLDQALSFSNGDLNADEISKFLGLGSYQLLDNLMESIINQDSARSLEVLNSLADYGADLPQCLKKLVTYFRDLMVYKSNPALIEVSETRLQKLTELSKAISVERLMKIVRLLIQTESNIKQLGYERVNFEVALIKLSRLRDDTIPLDKILGRLQEMESKIYSGIPESTSGKSEKYNNTTVVSAEIIEEKNELVEVEEQDPLKAAWSNILKNIKVKCPPTLHAVLKEAYVISIDDSAITLDFDAKFKWHREQLTDPSNLKLLETNLLEAMGKPMKFLIQSNNTSKANEDKETPASQREMRQDALQDETVKKVLEIFNGRIVDVKR